MSKKKRARTVFVVILEDRHDDPDVSVHKTRASANARVETHKAGYAWHAQSAPQWHVESAPPWVHFESAGADGPSVRIEKKTLE